MRDAFKQENLEQFVQEYDASATIVARPTQVLLRDDEGNNFIKASSLQFPHRVSGQDWLFEHRGGLSYFQHLESLSDSRFHMPEFVCILYNMFAQNQMVQRSYFQKNQESLNLLMILQQKVLMLLCIV